MDGDLNQMMIKSPLILSMPRERRHTSSLSAFVSAAPGCEAPLTSSAPPDVSSDLRRKGKTT